jgi:hypothetical protein
LPKHATATAATVNASALPRNIVRSTLTPV